jgi:tRNA modification GTPase
MELFDTIAAISTPPGEGGIGIVRISGNASKKIAKTLFKSRNGDSKTLFKSHYLNYGYIVEPSERTTIDEVLLSLMKGPHSYTGEDIVEIYAHGGNVVLAKILEAVLREGARPAQPGEFTKRAFLNGKIDLTQAEAVIDVIKAKTYDGLQCAQKQLHGSLRNEIDELKETLFNALVFLEAELDFSDDEVTPLSNRDLQEKLGFAVSTIEKLLSTYEEGKLMKCGLSTLILGRTNVGKSSLLNALLNENRAIVTPTPGTTRDSIQEELHIRGFPINLIDTAGLRETACLIEKEGIKKAQEKIQEAQLILFVVDGGADNHREDMHLVEGIQGKKILIVINKVDKVSTEKLRSLKKLFHHFHCIEISALNECGIDSLKEAMYSAITQNHPDGFPQTMISNLRHKKNLERAKAALERAMGSAYRDLMAVDLGEAVTALKEIIGEVTSADILEKIFSEFCIGK